jgi:hypothetical protein
MSLHLTDDFLRGMSPGGIVNMIGVLVLVAWLYGRPRATPVEAVR